MALVKTCDTKSYELAEHFLQDDPCRNDPKLFKEQCMSMALEIQQAVEDWFDTDAEAAALPRIPEHEQGADVATGDRQ